MSGSVLILLDFVCVCHDTCEFFCVTLYICWCMAGECWLRDMDLAHRVCELWLNPWVYCFRHALTTSPQWPGSRLHSSQGGPLLMQSPPSFPPLSVPLCPPSLLYPPSPLNLFQSLPSHCFFICNNPSCFPFPIYFFDTVFISEKQFLPMETDRHFKFQNILIRLVELNSCVIVFLKKVL